MSFMQSRFNFLYIFPTDTVVCYVWKEFFLCNQSKLGCRKTPVYACFIPHHDDRLGGGGSLGTSYATITLG